MTRLNLVPPEELMDQHLFAEFREIKMVPMSLNRSIMAATEKQVKQLDKGSILKVTLETAAASVLTRIPPVFTLNTGHVSFFYDKGAYLADRYEELKVELRKRGINFNEDSPLDPLHIYNRLGLRFYRHYEPTPEALALVRERIALRISQRPGWYRYYGEVRK